MVKAASMSTLNHDENEVILRNGSQESVKLALVKHARFNENDDISGNKICHNYGESSFNVNLESR